MNQIVMTLLFNWSTYGWTEGLDKDQEKNLSLASNVLSCFGAFIFYEVHWLFSWRYWEISEFLAG
jgi:hypothetical protein